MTRSELLAYGPLALELTWDAGWLASIRPRWAQDGETSRIATAHGRALQEAFARYVAGERVTWPELPVDLAALPPFFRAVLTELARIPAGETLSYGELAARCGRPGAARAVGQAMARNPWPLVYPCHRVLAAGGRIGGYGPGLEMKRWLLGLEGKLPA
ncbi:Methylated-DNA--protein-cysteine methyltransferase [Fundidesulfovibrio magnetotacticus]|uniref:Methylated-DNA--protein-cysteine methyltransferase n=1 Tax=Fundidesulfovibrio magnetotacticus TaxID=2730080 RepID=A0A6V8LU38_9BACT|nr:MGMT family protein [Fundidesulfovibrio magnetotacticus]GFK95234.1 Methylated-DNA--protein-cysteine methyltransferase [Fundidesulfovibrio magnetotacticus]